VNFQKLFAHLLPRGPYAPWQPQRPQSRSKMQWNCHETRLV